MSNELIFLYNNKRCHARVIDTTSKERANDLRYIGDFEEYEIYQIPTTMFSQFGFIAFVK